MRLARDGFPAHGALVSTTTKFENNYRKYTGNAEIWLPDGRPLALGQTFRQVDLAQTLQRLIDADSHGAKMGGRLAGLNAVHDLFYKGEIAAEMVRHVTTLDGWLSLEDLAAHYASVEQATLATVFGGVLCTCGPWSQGPSLSQVLMIYEHAIKVHPLNHAASSTHLLAESINLAMADREAFYGDPDFIDVPLGHLLSPTYAAERASMIDPDRAFGPLPPSGVITPSSPEPGWAEKGSEIQGANLDTSVAVIMDAQGNVFACTPSDASTDAPVVPNLGFVISTRGSQSHTAPGHPSALAPGKRPRITACPMLFIAEDGRVIAGGGPGGDLQVQAMAQTLIQHLVEKKSLTEAVAAPRVYSFSAPTSANPHLAFPGRLVVEEAFSENIMMELTELGHKTQRGAGSGINQPTLCLVAGFPGHGDYEAIGDPRSLSEQCARNSARSGR